MKTYCRRCIGHGIIRWEGHLNKCPDCSGRGMNAWGRLRYDIAHWFRP